MFQTRGMPAPLIGRHVDRYVIEAELGEGGFGAVYRARHSVVGRPVALKLLHLERLTSPHVVQRFLREAKASAAVGNPHIVQILDAGIADGQPFLAMELLEGEDLGERVARAGPPRVEDTLDLARQILDGLGAAHAAGIVHRDLKPANIFLARGPDGRDFVKLLDFGVSKIGGGAAIESLTRTGMILGTPHYMAPEQFRGAKDVDSRADLYSAAVVIYELLSGRLPYDADSYESLIVKMHTERPVPLAEVVPQLSAHLASIVDRGLARDPDGRWQTAAEMASAFAAIGDAAPVTLTRSPPQQAVPRAAPVAAAVPSRPVATPQPQPAGPPLPPTAYEMPAVARSVPPTGAYAMRPKVSGTGAQAPRGRAGALLFFGFLAVLGAALAAGIVVLALSAVNDQTATPPGVTPTTAAATPSSTPAPGAPAHAGPPVTEPPKPEPTTTAPVAVELNPGPAPDRPGRPRDRPPPATAMTEPPAPATPEPVISPPDTTPPPAGSHRVSFRVSSLADRVRQAGLEAMMRQALGRMTVCRPSGAEEEVQIQGVVSPTGQIVSVSPAPGSPRLASSECVARAIRGVGRVEDPGASGIFRATVVLPPR